MIGFISLFAMLAAVPAYFSICRKENPERITLMALLANVLLFYLFSIFHLMNVGAGIIMAVNFAFFIPVIRQLLREPAAYRRFLTPAMTVYFMLIPVLYAATYYLEFVQWDEFSHWGFASKLLFRNGRLNCELDNYLKHASYPPGIPLLVPGEVIGEDFEQLIESREQAEISMKSTFSALPKKIYVLKEH